MRKARYLAPWHRQGTDLGLAGIEAEALARLRGKAAIYHCVSRVVNRDFVLGGEEKEHFGALMRTYEQFCQVRVLTYCVMSNHFHILLEVPAPPEDGGASWSDERLLDHLGLLYSKRQLGKIQWELEHYRSQHNTEAAEAMRQKFFNRMWDLSAFMKVLKQRFTQWFNRKHERRGYLWEERFKSVLVEDGHAAQTVAAYIDLNPVRAGLVKDPKDYRWSGYGEAIAGTKRAREGLLILMFEKLSAAHGEMVAAANLPTWREVVRRYRVVLFEDGEESQRDQRRKRQGITRRRVAAVLARDGRLSEAEMLRCKVRYFLDGMVIGRKQFVNEAFMFSRSYFGSSRESGARKMQRVRSELRSMRDLQKDPIT